MDGGRVRMPHTPGLAARLTQEVINSLQSVQAGGAGPEDQYAFFSATRRARGGGSVLTDADAWNKPSA